MLKHLSIFAALVVLGTGSANAQQREAVLQKVEVPNAGFNLVLGMPKLGTPSLYLRDQPDPNVIYLMGEELVYAYTGGPQEPLDIWAFMAPACSFHVERGEGGPPTPLVVYVAPKVEIPPATATR
jgi:hypothetical protein